MGGKRVRMKDDESVQMKRRTIFVHGHGCEVHFSGRLKVGVEEERKYQVD